MPDDIWAVVPMKDTRHSKQRLSGALSPALRQRLAIAMFADVLDVLFDSKNLAGILVVTEDAEITRLATARGARIITDGATQGHTGAVLAAARILTAERRGGMLAVPGDIPLLTSAEIETLLAAHQPAPCFTIVPAHDGRGSNAVVLSPPDIVPLQFGGTSFAPHIATARRLGVRVVEVHLAGIALDIDDPNDITRFLRIPSNTRARKILCTESEKEARLF